jgi:hypothetical protein
MSDHMSDGYETRRLNELLGAIAGAAGGAARPAGPAGPWRRGRRRRGARLVAQGGGALLLVGGMLAVPGLVANGPVAGTGATPSPSPSPAATPGGPERVPPGVPPAARIRAQGEIWTIYAKVENATRCLLLQSTLKGEGPDGGWDVIEVGIRADGSRLLVPSWRCEGRAPSGLRLHNPVQLLLERGDSRVTELIGVADQAAARVEIELVDGRAIELDGDRLPAVAGTSLRFFAVKLAGEPRIGRLVAHRAGGGVLGVDDSRVDRSTTPPDRLVRPSPDYGGIIEVRFSRSAAPRERTDTLVAVEERQATIEWARGDRYFLQATGDWRAVVAVLDAARDAGLLRYTVVQEPAGSAGGGP